ncbi:prepilin-type N-terminal cleavage/methylation domain-containing protein [Parelusimicrobium proximum]|uniref:type IV pilin protein n=1 Tax=Parelusimicrobium proximum TaxID=3228953 RepID=UPI003D171185
MNNKAFTLIELMVVVIIVAVLAAIAIPQYGRALERARITEMLANTGSLQKAQERYKFQFDSYAEDIHKLDAEYPNKTGISVPGFSGYAMYKIGSNFVYGADPDTDCGASVSARYVNGELTYGVGRYPADSNHTFAGKTVCYSWNDKYDHVCTSMTGELHAAGSPDGAGKAFILAKF